MGFSQHETVDSVSAAIYSEFQAKICALWYQIMTFFLVFFAKVLRNKGVYENVKYVQQENFWIGPSSVC